MSEVLAFPVIKNEVVRDDHQSMLEIALELVRDVRAGKIAGLAIVAVYPEEDALRSRWATTDASIMELASAAGGLAHDLYASRTDN
jgi:hypothetical protein